LYEPREIGKYEEVGQWITMDGNVTIGRDEIKKSEIVRKTYHCLEIEGKVSQKKLKIKKIKKK
jgi:hypothetical protein